MTNEELDKLAQSIFEQMQVSILPEVDSFKWTYDTGSVRKLLRSIEIAALREARELVAKAVAHYHASAVDFTERDDFVRSVALQHLDKRIREIELR